MFGSSPVPFSLLEEVGLDYVIRLNLKIDIENEIVEHNRM